MFSGQNEIRGASNEADQSLPELHYLPQAEMPGPHADLKVLEQKIEEK